MRRRLTYDASAENTIPLPPDAPRSFFRRGRRLSAPASAVNVFRRIFSQGEDDELQAPQRYQSTRTHNSQASMEFSKPKLDRIQLFQKCNPCFLEALYHQLENEVFEVGAEILRQGDIGTCMYLLNFGEVEVCVGENATVVASLGSGSLFGEMAAICKNPAAAKRTATIRAKTMCHCWRIDRPSLMSLFAVYPKDEAIISAEADRRFQDLVGRGLITLPEKKHPYRHEQEARRDSRPGISPRSLNKRKTVNVLMKLGQKVVSESSERRDTFESEGSGDDMSDSGDIERVSTIQSISTFDLERASTMHSLSSPRYTSGGSERCSDRYSYNSSVSTSTPRGALPPLDVKAMKADAVLFGSESTVSPRSARSLRTKSWQIGETSEVKKVRNSVTSFLAKRGM